MSGIDLAGIFGLGSSSSSVERFVPEPRGTGSGNFSGFLSKVGNALVGGAEAALPNINPAYLELMQEQMRVQQENQLVSFHSNIEKSKHETQMAVVRNLRVG